MTTPTANVQSGSSLCSRHWTWLAPLTLLGTAIFAYHNSFNGPFIFDDLNSIRDNPHIRRLWPLWEAMSAPPQSSVAGRPVVSLSLAFNFALGGLDVRSYHAFNLAIHLLASLALFGIVRRTLCSGRLQANFGPDAAWLALAVALLWLVHPMQTESVTYVIQRAEALMGMFYLVTLYCAIRALESVHPWKWYAAAAGACALGMGCKEVMVTAPLLVVLYDWVFLCSPPRQILRQRWPLYAGLGVTWLILAWLVASGPRTESAGFGLKQITPMEYARTQCAVVVHYLRLCVWPHPLVLDYSWPVPKAWADVLPSLLLLVTLLCLTAISLFRRSPLGYLGAWCFGILALTSSVVPIADTAFEHRMYLSLAAVATLAVMSAHLAFQMWRRRVVEGMAILLIAVVFSALTALRNTDYQSDVSIWSDTVKKRPTNSRAQNNLGFALTAEGRYDEAIAHCSEALQLDPRNADAHNNLGLAIAAVGRTAEAVTHYREALQIRPDYREAHINLGVALACLGKADEAITQYREALRISPDSIDAHNNLGIELAAQGKTEEGIAHYREALRIKPDYEKAHLNLGVSLAARGNTEEAIAHYREALRVKPHYGEAHYNLGLSLAAKGRLDEAIQHYLEVVRLKPAALEARNNLGLALAARGRTEEAIAVYRAALHINPNHNKTHYNLGVVLAEQGKLDEAAQHYTEATRIHPAYAEAYNNWGLALAAQGKWEEAILRYSSALRIRPQYEKAQYNLGIALAAQGKLDQASAQFRELLRRNPSLPEAHYSQSTVLGRLGKSEAAVTHLREALRLRPSWSLAVNQLAWLLATTDDPKAWNPAEALQLAEQLVKAGGGQVPEGLDTLAAAYAAGGRFPEAVDAAQQAIQLALASHRKELAAGIQNRLDLYRKSLPFRETVKPLFSESDTIRAGPTIDQ